MMYLFDSYPIVVSRELATLIGLNEAIVLQQIHYWVQKNKENGTNFFEGNYWTFNTVKEWHEKNFPFLSTNTIIRTFSKLEKMNLIKVGNFNRDGRDQTKWYTINYDELEKLYLSHFNKSTETDEKTLILKLIIIKQNFFEK